MRNNHLAIVMPFAGEFDFIEETIMSLSACKGIDELVIAIDTTKVNNNDHKTQLEKIITWQNPSFDWKIIESFKPGPAAARNLAIQESQSEYVLPVDADDKIANSYPSKIKDILAAPENDKVGIVYGAARMFGEINSDWNLPEFSLEQICLENCIYATAGFRRVDWEKVGGYDEELIYGQEDWDFWLKIISKGREVHFLEDLVFFYRIRPGSRSKTFSGMWEQVIWTYNRVCSNNKEFMASRISDVYNRRIVLELQLRHFKDSDIKLGYLIARRFPRLIAKIPRRVIALIKSSLK